MEACHGREEEPPCLQPTARRWSAMLTLVALVACIVDTGVVALVQPLKGKGKGRGRSQGEVWSPPWKLGVNLGGHSPPERHWVSTHGGSIHPLR